MKVKAIINTIRTYSNLNRALASYKAQYRYYEMYDDTEGMKNTQKIIDDINNQIGQFLDMEV